MSERRAVEWTACPWRERLVISIVALLLVGVVSVLFVLATQQVYWGLLAFAVLFLSIRSHYQSTSYRLDETGVTVETRWGRTHKPWQSFRTFRIDRDRLVLSPFPRYTWLEPYRSLKLRLSGDPSQVRSFALIHLPEQAPRLPRDRTKGTDEAAAEEGLSRFDEELLDRVASKIVAWRMSVPAVLFLETGKPLSFLGSQALVFLEPFVHSLFTVPDYERFCQAIEKRENVELLIQKVEAKEEELKEEERSAKKRRKG